MDRDDENGIVMESEEEEKREIDQEELNTDYPARDLSEFLFWDEEGCFNDSISAEDKNELFNRFVAPMVLNYQEIKNKYASLVEAEGPSETDENAGPPLEPELPDMDFLGRVWSEIKKKTVFDTSGPSPVKMTQQSPDPEVCVEEEEKFEDDECGDVDEFTSTDIGEEGSLSSNMKSSHINQKNRVIHNTLYNNREFDIETIRIRFTEYSKSRNPYHIAEMLEKEINNLGA